MANLLSPARASPRRLLALAALASAASAGPLSVTVNTTDGTFVVSVGGAAWLQGGDIGVYSGGQARTVGNGGLTLASWKTESGSDALGDYFAYDITWNVAPGGGVQMYTIVRDYTASGVPALVFEQVRRRRLECPAV